MTKYKAISRVDGDIYTLGMGPAEVVKLKRGKWLNGGKYGWTVGPSRTIARAVIYWASQRKVLPVPENMEVIEVEVRGFIWGNGWREAYREIKVP